MKEYKWCAIDAEGDVGKLGLLGVAFYSDMVQTYERNLDAIRRLLLEHAEAGYTFLAHNAQYDIPVIFWQLGIEMRTVYYNGRFNRGEWRYAARKPLCQLWDTLALSGGLSLEKLGTALGIPKLETPQILKGHDPDRYKWRCDTHGIGECLDCYAIRDAEITYRFMSDLSEQMAAWGITPQRRISSLAMAVWKELDHPDSIAITDYKTRELGRRAYHGGRVDTFKLGYVAPIYTADIGSMYPSVMLNTLFPDPAHMRYLQNPSLSAVPIECEGVATVDITIPSMYVPPLPLNYKGELLYPIGRMVGHWTLAEIRYAVSLGCRVNAWHAVAFSTHTVSPFQRFVQTLWQMREAYEFMQDPRSLFAKLLMNNLYGRLGMKGKLDRKDIYPCPHNTALSSDKMTGWYTEDGKLYITHERHTPSKNEWTNVLWAAQITGAGRILLHRHLVEQGPNLAYCDTDSVFSTAPLNGLGDGLGELRSPEQYRAAIIAQPKLYALQSEDGEWHAKAKGVPHKHALHFLREGFATYQQPIKPSSQRSRKIEAGTWVDVTKINQRTPHRRQPTNPDALFQDLSSSDTVPPFVGPTV